MDLTAQLVDTLKAHLAGDKRPVPEAGIPLWNAFCELSATRTYGFSGPNPIPWTEIEAWSTLMRWPLEPHHVRAIRALDLAWLEHARAKGAPPAAPQAISTAAFDAAFDAAFGG